MSKYILHAMFNACIIFFVICFFCYLSFDYPVELPENICTFAFSFKAKVRKTSGWKRREKDNHDVDRVVFVRDRRRGEVFFG